MNATILAAFNIMATVLRRSSPETERTFRCPLVPLIPALEVSSCASLIPALPTIPRLRFGIRLVMDC